MHERKRKRDSFHANSVWKVEGGDLNFMHLKSSWAGMQAGRADKTDQRVSDVLVKITQTVKCRVDKKRERDTALSCFNFRCSGWPLNFANPIIISICKGLQMHQESARMHIMQDIIIDSPVSSLSLSP